MKKLIIIIGSVLVLVLGFTVAGHTLCRTPGTSCSVRRTRLERETATLTAEPSLAQATHSPPEAARTVSRATVPALAVVSQATFSPSPIW